MKQILRLTVACVFFRVTALGGDGGFLFFTKVPLTHVGSPDGPLADKGIFAEVFAGATPDHFVDLGLKFEFTGGFAYGGVVVVPFLNSGDTAYVRYAAWDSQYGSELSSVPANLMAFSDVSSNYLFPADSDQHTVSHFLVPLVVPTAVPEPKMIGLFTFGLLGIAQCMKGR